MHAEILDGITMQWGRQAYYGYFQEVWSSFDVQCIQGNVLIA